MLAHLRVVFIVFVGLSISLILSATGASARSLYRPERRDGYQVPKNILWPSQIISVDQTLPDDALGIKDDVFIYSIPGSTIDVCAEVAYSLPQDIDYPAQCQFDFFSMDAVFRMVEWDEDIDQEQRVGIFAFSEDSVSVSPEDTWNSRPNIDYAQGAIAIIIVNNTGVYIESEVFDCYKTDEVAGFWLQCEADQYCHLIWPETVEPLYGLVVRVYEASSISDSARAIDGFGMPSSPISINSASELRD